MNIVDGALRGVDIPDVLRDARSRIAQLRGHEVQPSAADKRTTFSELAASFTVREGVARNSDLSMKSSLLRAGGEGTVDIGNATVDYVLRATVIGAIAVPVKITGPLSAPQYDFDLRGMITGAVPRALERLGSGLRRQQPDTGGGAAPADRPSPGDLLKGILGR